MTKTLSFDLGQFLLTKTRPKPQNNKKKIATIQTILKK